MLKADSDGRLALSGALTSREVPSLYHASEAWKHAGMPQVVDLAQVDQTDSSALALLLEWKSWAQSANHAIRFINVPRSLCVLASLSQIGELLGWKTLDFESAEETGQCCG